MQSQDPSLHGDDLGLYNCGLLQAQLLDKVLHDQCMHDYHLFGVSVHIANSSKEVFLGWRQQAEYGLEVTMLV